LSASDHMRRVVGDCSQSLYALRVLRHNGLTDVCLHTVFRSVVVAKLLYACTAWSGFITTSDRHRVDAFSAAANAVATVIQTFQLSTNFLRRVTIGCFTNSVDIHYITFSHHPPQHHNTTTSAVHQHITDSYQHAQATSLTATSSHAYCTKTVTELLSQCDFLLCILLGLSTLKQQCVLSFVDFKEMNK